MNKELKQEINRAAHCFAQQQFYRIRGTLAAKCKQMVSEGKSTEEIRAFLLSASLSEGI